VLDNPVGAKEDNARPGKEAALARRRQVQRKRRTREHVIADLSINHVERHVLLCGFTVERIIRDYGLDLFLATYDVNGEVENGQVLLQVKATDQLRVSAAGDVNLFRLEVAHVRAWLGELMPVILIVYDAQADTAYWLYVQSHFESRRRQLRGRGRATLTVRIPRANVLNETAVRKFAEFRDRVSLQVSPYLRHHE
jgi:hypothetical protein